MECTAAGNRRLAIHAENTVPPKRAGRFLAAGVPILATAALLVPFIHAIVSLGVPGHTVLAASKSIGTVGKEASDLAKASIQIDYPQDASIFPPA